jgi:hypothetical protein
LNISSKRSHTSFRFTMGGYVSCAVCMLSSYW